MTDAAERDRLRALHALRILDTPAEERFDRITRTAARVIGVPVAMVNFVDAERQWTKSCFGADLKEVPRDQSLCSHGLDHPSLLVVEDASRDPRFRDNPLVVGPPHIRFYAGVVVRSADGRPLGRLCVTDREPRRATDAELEALADLAPWVEVELHGGAAPGAPQDALALMQERFLGVAAHELRTPLTLILGYSEELLDPIGDPLDAYQQEAAEAIARGALRLQELVDDLLFVLELDAGRILLAPEPVALEAVARSVRDDLLDDALSRGVRIDVEAGGAGTASADAGRLARALGALVRNAITWSPPGGVVRIGAHAGSDGELRLTVSDSGPGLPDDEHEALGLRFRRMRGTDPREGPGLGLAICRGLVELHGGRLEAGTSDDGGAALSIILPDEMSAPATA